MENKYQNLTEKIDEQAEEYLMARDYLGFRLKGSERKILDLMIQNKYHDITTRLSCDVALNLYNQQNSNSSEILEQIRKIFNNI